MVRIDRNDTLLLWDQPYVEEFSAVLNGRCTEPETVKAVWLAAASMHRNSQYADIPVLTCLDNIKTGEWQKNDAPMKAELQRLAYTSPGTMRCLINSFMTK
jgi:hypothetical protein